MFVAFAPFVIADGATHLAAVWTDVVVSDLAMPARDGYALLHALHGRGLARGLVTITLTAHARREDREHALSPGYDAYVLKPVKPAALAAPVRELVKRRRPAS